MSDFNLNEVKAAIDTNNAEYTRAFLAGDGASFSELHHSASVNMPPHDSPKNKEEMGDLVKNVPGYGINKIPNPDNRSIWRS